MTRRFRSTMHKGNQYSWTTTCKAKVATMKAKFMDHIMQARRVDIICACAYKDPGTCVDMDQ